MSSNTDLIAMLDELNLPLAVERLAEILNSPEPGNYSPQQLLRGVIEPPYMKALDKRYMSNLQLSRLINKLTKTQIKNPVAFCGACGI